MATSEQVGGILFLYFVYSFQVLKNVRFSADFRRELTREKINFVKNFHTRNSWDKKQLEGSLKVFEILEKVAKMNMK